MLTLREFRNNHHPSVVKMLAKFARRGIRGKIINITYPRTRLFAKKSLQLSNII